MSVLTVDHSYWLRSSSSAKQQSVSTSSPTSPPGSPSPITMAKDSTPSTINFTRNTRNRRKRRFHQLNEHHHHHAPDDNEDIDLNVSTNNISTDTIHKKAKLSRTVKFTLQATPNLTTSNKHNNLNKTNNKTRKIKRIRLTFNNKHNNKCNKCTKSKQNLEKVISREASLNANSPIVTKKRRRVPRIEEYEVPTSHRITRRNPFVCCYEFFNGYKIGIVATLGSAKDLKAAIKILSQELVSGRAKASIQTQKNSFLVYIKTRKGTLIGCSILHIDHVWKRVNIEMFAVDKDWRGNGFASLMVYLIQYRMLYFAKYDLFVCAANSAVPFWSNNKYKFVFAHKGILEQHEVEDEKHGGTKHMIWYGTPAQARCSLLKYFARSQ